jgi:hypothetical protein
MSNTADVTSGKPIAVSSQSTSDVSAINPLVAFYDIHGRKREVFFCFVPDTTRDSETESIYLLKKTHYKIRWVVLKILSIHRDRQREASLFYSIYNNDTGGHI